MGRSSQMWKFRPHAIDGCDAIAGVSPRRLRTGFLRRLTGLSAAVAIVAACAAVLAPASSAAPRGPAMPVEFDLARYQPVSPTPFRSLAYADNGKSFFFAGPWMCQIGGQYRYVGCKGRPATAPPTARGAIIVGDIQGPWWVVPGGPLDVNYRFGSKAGFRPPVLGVGKRVTIEGVTCTAPRPSVVACRTAERAMILTPSWHKFFWPSWDTIKPGNNAVAHDGNPAPRYLPPRLQYWNQLPANPPAPK